jgi:FixJ family two-component response regulator
VLAPPYDETALAARVRDVLERDGEGVVRRQRRRAILSRMASLTRREREVMNHVVAGRSNKQVADAMGVSIKTVEVHRSRVMRKMDAGSLAGLVQQYLFVSRGNGNGDHSDPPGD